MGRDAADAVDLCGLEEDAERWEALVQAEAARAASDPAARNILESMYWEQDRAAAFDRFLASRDFAHIRRILALFGVRPSDSVCEIGGGSGHLVWALSRSGYTDLSLVEPNSCHLTGTGYLKSRDDSAGIRIHGDLPAWCRDTSRYRVIVTRNCVHHFKNISIAAAQIRKTMQAGGLWFMIREWFADSPGELYRLLREHPYSQKYRVYEYPFPASHYVEAVEIAGLRLIGVVPARYANDCLGAYNEGSGGPGNRRFTNLIDAVLTRGPRLTVAAYGAELFINRHMRNVCRLFTRPQVMIFRHAEVM